MKLEDIGFYTLEDSRAANVSEVTPLWRCELILTPKCNFKCPYCRGTDAKELTFEEAKNVVDLWGSQGLQNIRFSGGEPTLWPRLADLVEHVENQSGIERIAISTNGSADFSVYDNLIYVGVNDFSISLDACCASTGEIMSGGKKGMWEKVTENIKELSKHTYTTVGVVLTEINVDELKDIIQFASEELGVADIRIISAAQWNANLNLSNLNLKNNHPILNYRLNNMKIGKRIRGLTETDNRRCPLILDDMVIKGDYHYPCIIHMREGGKPIGSITGKTMKQIRGERSRFSFLHNTHEDPICKNNCLDVCVDYNNKVRELNKIWRALAGMFDMLEILEDMALEIGDGYGTVH